MSASATDRGCPDLSGEYRLVGKWLSKPDPNYALPRIDEWAFAFIARKIIDPTKVIVSHNPAGGSILVDVVGSGIDPRWPDAPKKLPLERKVTCSGEGWHFVQVSKGGGDNAPSTMETRVSLTLSEDGQLTATGSQDITTGYLIPTKRTSQWSATFPRFER